MADINLGDNYSVDEDSNGDLIIQHDPSGNQIKYDSANGGFVGDNFNSIGAEQLNSADIDNSESGEVLTSQGDGTLDFGPQNPGSEQQTWTYLIFNDGVEWVVLSSDSSREVTRSNPSDAIEYAITNAAGGPVFLAGDTTFALSSQVSITDGSDVNLRAMESVMVDGTSVPSEFSFKFKDAGNLVVENVHYTAGSTEASFLQFGRCDNVRITKNQIDGGGNGIYGGFDDGGNSDVIITENHVYGQGDYGILMAEGGNASDPNAPTTNENVTIANNQVDNTGLNGIGVYSTEEFAVVGNVVDTAGHSPIAVSSGRQGSVTGNKVRNATDASEACIEVEHKSDHGSWSPVDVTVSGNSVGIGEWGIFIGNRDGDGQADPRAITVTGNSVYDCDIGIYAREGEGIVVDGNILRNNTTQIDTTGATNVTTGDNGTM